MLGMFRGPRDPSRVEGFWREPLDASACGAKTVRCRSRRLQSQSVADQLIRRRGSARNVRPRDEGSGLCPSLNHFLKKSAPCCQDPFLTKRLKAHFCALDSGLLLRCRHCQEFT